MELLEASLRTTYFQVNDKFFSKKMAWQWVAPCPWCLVTSYGAF